MRTISTLDDFHALVKSESPKLVVVDFFAEWCGPCKRVAPQYAQLAEIHSKTACFVKVDVDASPELSSFGRISAMPTFQVYKGGERVAEVKGARMDELERSIALWGADVERQLAAAAAAAATHVPLQQLLRFEDGKVEKIVPKLLQFNDELRAEGHAHALDDAGAAALKQLGAALEKGAAARHPHVLFATLLRWPSAKLFPALDLLRLAALQPAAAVHFAAALAASDGVGDLVVSRALAADAGEVNHMLALRFCANLLAALADAPGASLAHGGAPLVAPALEAAAAAAVHESGRPGARLALSTLALNMAVALRRGRADSAAKTPCVIALQQLLTSEQPDAEVRYRAVLALGTLVHEDADSASLAVGLDLPTALAALAVGDGATDKLRACVAEVQALIAQPGEPHAAAAADAEADAALYG